MGGAQGEVDQYFLPPYGIHKYEFNVNLVPGGGCSLLFRGPGYIYVMASTKSEVIIFSEV